MIEGKQNKGIFTQAHACPQRYEKDELKIMDELVKNPDEKSTMSILIKIEQIEEVKNLQIIPGQCCPRFHIR